MAGVRFEHVYKIYENQQTVIQDFNLEVYDGEFLILVGPSGCGKSTTLRMIAGLEEVSRGDLYISDKRVNDVPPRDRNIAMVFQNYALYPHLTVRENLGFSLKLKGVAKAEIAKKVQEAAEILGLQSLMNKKPKQLSGGQCQRVAMGRAIVRSPQVFLFDEPLSNLDAKLRVQMRVELAKLHKKLKTTIVYVTHDQVEAMTLGDRIVVMKDGVIQQIGTPMELYDKPTNAFVAGFIGSPAMNQIPASITAQNGTVTIAGKDISIPISQDKAKMLETYIGQKVLLGIRPQDISPQLDAHGKVALNAEVEVIETLGGESYVYFTLADKQWVARSEGTARVEEGKPAFMVVDMDRLHIFTEDGHKRLF